PPANGYKRFVFPDGKGVYDGHWRGYKRHGHGSFSFANGDTYDGEPGILSGNGVSRCFWIGFLWVFEMFTGEQCYTGQWKDGKRHGHGRHYF
ncbi:unnamed protein product, partial [Pylaiella littoralis]